jgi:iron complex transport system substrate-binding protein
MMHRKATVQDELYRLLYLLIIVALAVPASVIQTQAREITDIFGKKVSIPDHPKKVYATSPPITYMLYAIDPSMIAGLNAPAQEWEKQYRRKGMQELPVLGGWFGQGNTPNLEMILKVNPEIIITSKYKSAMNDKTERVIKTLPMPVVSVPINTLSDYPGAFLYLGQVLGRRARSEELAAYARKMLSEMAALTVLVAIPKRVSVYYAEGVDGLSTECDSSPRSEVINLVGGQNVHRCRSWSSFGREKISFEQLMLYNPEVILVFEKTFYEKVFSDPLWQRIKAVRNKRVHLIPSQPFNWFDRPPSFMRLLGAKWLANLLYPERYHINIVKETRQFYKLFLGVDLTAEEAGRLVQAR